MREKRIRILMIIVIDVLVMKGGAKYVITLVVVGIEIDDVW